VKFTSDTEPGRYAAGKKVTFTAEYALQDDNRMEVYANSTLLKPDAGGNYSVDINANTINLKVSDEELARRRANWTPKTKEVSGYLKRYRRLVTSADKGAILED
jgi:hypothetical protein